METLYNSSKILIYCIAPKGRIVVLPRWTVVKNMLPMQEMQEMRVQSLGWEDPLGWETATHSSILAWKIPWTEEPGGL